MTQNEPDMIVTETPTGWRCITQPDHARLSHDLLALWRNDALERHPRRDELLLAVREHDNGWQEADSAPQLDPASGGPYDFTAAPAASRLEVWRRGIARHREHRPYVAALIAEHARYLHRAAEPEPGPWRDFLAGLEAQRDEALAEAAYSVSALRQDYRWLHWADLVSLALCAAWQGTHERWGLQVRVTGETVHIEPFPLAGSTAFSVPCRYLERGSYTSDVEIATALALCRWRRLDLRVAP